MGVIDDIKERIDIVEFISATVPLRKTGRAYLGFCPFHANTRTPAFTVYPETQSYHCFGCKASGTVFDFVMQREGLDFRQVLEQLAQRAGIQLKERTEDDEAQDHLRTRLLEINAAAAVFFHHMLVKSPRGEAARAYVAKRALDADTQELFQLGFAPDGNMLVGYLTDRKGFELEDIEAAGLIIHRDSGGYYDRFRDRLMFPIRNAKAEVIAFGGRSLGDAQPKYMNSPQTALFDKSRVLYGIDLARDPIRNQGAAVIVEGYVDVVVAHQHGFRNVVAPLGTALTGDHVGVLKKLTKQVYLALDADEAGIRATMKGVQTLIDHADGEPVPVPTPQGIVRWEHDMSLEIKILSLPDGKDPDEVIGANPDQWRALIDSAQPVMEFYIHAATADLDLHTGKGKAEAVARLAPIVMQIANPVEQAHHIQQIARLVGVEEHVVRAALPTPRRRETARSAPPPAVVPDASAPGKEAYLLSMVIRYPSAEVAVQEKLNRDLAHHPQVAACIGGTLLELFEDVSNRAIWRSWSEPTATRDIPTWYAQLDDTLRGQADRVLHLELPESQSYRYVNDALECARMLQRRLAKRWKDRFTQQVNEEISEEERMEALERLVHIKSYIDAISTPKRSSTYDDLHSLRTA